MRTAEREEFLSDVLADASSVVHYWATASACVEQLSSVGLVVSYITIADVAATTKVGPRKKITTNDVDELFRRVRCDRNGLDVPESLLARLLVNDALNGAGTGEYAYDGSLADAIVQLLYHGRVLYG